MKIAKTKKIEKKIYKYWANYDIDGLFDLATKVLEQRDYLHLEVNKLKRQLIDVSENSSSAVTNSHSVSGNEEDCYLDHNCYLDHSNNICMYKM